MGRATRIAAAALLAVVVHAPPGAAGASYVVEGCTLDDGTPAPAAGWTFAAATEWGRGNATCEDPSAPLPSLSGSIDWSTFWFGRQGGTTSSSASWTFTAPPDTLIEGYRIYRYEDSTFAGAVGPGVYGEVRWSDSGGVLDAGCTVAALCARHGTEAPYGRLSSENLAEADGLNARWVRASAVCTPVATSATACPTDGDVLRGRFRIYASRIRLRDLAAPAVLAPASGGLLVAGRPLDGERVVRVAASDRGGGLARAVLYADGHEVADAPPDGTGCAGPAALVPCPLRASFTVVLDTRRLTDGPHALELRVADIGGNETTAGRAVVTVDNAPSEVPRPAPSPSLPAAPAPLAPLAPVPPRFEPLAPRTVAYGAEPLLRGRLAGGPHAAVSVAFRVARAGAPWEQHGTVETDAGGAFALRVPAGPSRDVRLRSGGAETVVRVTVRAGIALTAVRHGPTVLLSGRLRGGPGRAGTRVELSAAGHVNAITARADAQGRFHARYRLPGAGRFTAALLPRPGYPYAAGRSRTVSVNAPHINPRE
jgi:hypothetical protein